MLLTFINIKANNKKVLTLGYSGHLLTNISVYLQVELQSRNSHLCHCHQQRDSSHMTSEHLQSFLNDLLYAAADGDYPHQRVAAFLKLQRELQLFLLLTFCTKPEPFLAFGSRFPVPQNKRLKQPSSRMLMFIRTRAALLLCTTCCLRKNPSLSQLLETVSHHHPHSVSLKALLPVPGRQTA